MLKIAIYMYFFTEGTYGVYPFFNILNFNKKKK